MSFKNYEEAREAIENASWFREITGRNFPAARMAELSREQFIRELRIVIERHRRQQVHIDKLKQLCRTKA